MPNNSWCVLIAATDKDLREPLAAVLRERYGYQVDTVCERQEVMPLLRGATLYDAMLFEDQLFKEVGQVDPDICVAIIREMKKVRPATQILIHTGGDAVLSRVAMKEGAFCCEQHPFDLEGLAMHVYQAVRFQQRFRVEQVLHKLITPNSKLHDEKSEGELIDEILKGVQGFGYDRVRLYLLSEDGRFLEAVAGLAMGAEFERTRLPLEDCYFMKQLLEARRPMVFRRVDHVSVPFEQILDKEDVDEWASVPMFLDADGDIIGKLSVDNKSSGRLILEEDLLWVEVVAGHAARAIRNRQAVERDGRRRKKLDRLRQAAIEMTEQPNREALLDTMTRHAQDLVGAKGCGVYALRASPARKPDKLAIIKDRARDNLKKKELVIGEGMAGKLVNSKKPYWIVDDYDKWEGRAPALEGVFGAVLEVPLKWKSQAIGVLYVDDSVGRKFTEEEGELLSLFGQHAASALVHIERNDNLEDLLSSSPIGIISVDGNGNVDRINEAALSLLKQSKKEVMGEYVGPLFQDDLEPRKIGRLLHENGGKFANYRTKIKTSEGTAIPILHSSTWLHDSTGNRAGSIAFFEDLRPLQLLMESSDIVARESNPSDGLRELAKRMAALLPHAFFRVLLVDATGDKLTVEAAHFPTTDAQSPTRRNAGRPIVIARWAGLWNILKGESHKEFRSSKHDPNPFLQRYSDYLGLDELVQSLLVVPLKVEDGPVGLFEFGQLGSDQPFTPQETQFAISIAANTAALIRLIRFHEATKSRNHELERENDAIRMMSGVDTVRDALLRIVSQTKNVFGCSSATIWPYDTLGERFIPKELVSDGISDEVLNKFRKMEPTQRGVTNSVRKQGWLPVEDVFDLSLEFLTPNMRNLLAEDAGIRSFQGVHLRVGEETVGVLYASYPAAREFGAEDRQSLERFGAYAALSLKNARSSEQLVRTRKAAQAVARVIALGDLKGTLESVCREMKRLTGCDVAVLYAYDSIRERLGSPPTYYGRVRFPDGMLNLTEVPLDAPIRKFLEKKKPIIIEDTSDQLSPLKESRFTRDEKIFSCVVVPLWVADRRVGVVFVNFRKHRRFTSDEIANIELICRLAAIAVSNAQHFDRTDRHSKGQGELLSLSGSLLGQLSLNEILNKSVDKAFAALKPDFSNIVLPDDQGNPVFVAGKGWPEDMKGRVFGKDTGSQTGYTIKTREPVRVYDYNGELPFDVSEVVRENGILSGLSVPMWDRDQVVGALLVHSKQFRHFSKREEDLLQIIANHAAIAIENAKRLLANERKSTRLRALNEAAKAITESFGSERATVLNKILEQAVACIRQRVGLETLLGTIQEYDEDTRKMVFVGARSSDDDSTPIVEKIGNRRSIDRAAGHRIGVIGRTVEEKKAQIVRDVSKDRDFVVFKWEEGSEITAPLLDGDKVLGVINVESNTVGALDEEDKVTLNALADLAVVALRNAQQYDELRQSNDQLRQINGLIGSRTVLQWMEEIAKAFGHYLGDMLSSANTSIDKLEALVVPAGKVELHKLRESVGEFKPTKLDELVFEEPKPIPLLKFIRDYVTYRNGQSHQVAVERPNPIDDKITIKASRVKLMVAIDHVVNNSIRAIDKAGTERRIIFRIDVLPETKKLKILISDSGPGIPKDIEDRIRGGKRIEKSAGMGIGLMLTRNMVESYGGEFELVQTSSKGTEFAITFPYQTEQIEH